MMCSEVYSFGTVRLLIHVYYVYDAKSMGRELVHCNILSPFPPPCMLHVHVPWRYVYFVYVCFLYTSLFCILEI